MATHSSVLAMRIPRTGEHGGLPSIGLHRSDTTEVTYQQKQRFPSSGDLPYPGVEPMSPVLQVDSLPLRHLERPNLKKGTSNLGTELGKLKVLLSFLLYKTSAWLASCWLLLAGRASG